MIRTALVCCILTLAAGCTTTPVDMDRTTRVEASAILDAEMLRSGPDKGTLRIGRDAGPWAGGVDTLIYIDGRHVANLESNRVLVLEVPAGKHTLGAQASGPTFPIKRLDIVVEAGKTVDIRNGFSPSKDMIFERVN